MEKLKTLDARFYQLAFQAVLLSLGVLLRDFSLHFSQMLFALLSAFLTQFFWLRFFKLQNAQIGYLSAVITGMGLSLLLRSDSFWIHPLVAFLAISSKFLLRVDGQHIFNPANLGVGLALLFLPGAWVSPGQWGNDLSIGVWLIALGFWVTQKSHRLDAAQWFLGCYLGLAALRVLILGYSADRAWDVWSHQALNGALLLFAFFMVSDPMTLPRHYLARRIHLILLAFVSAAWQFLYFQPHGFLWALLFLSVSVPLWNRLFPAPRFNW